MIASKSVEAIELSLLRFLICKETFDFLLNDKINNYFF